MIANRAIREGDNAVKQPTVDRPHHKGQEDYRHGSSKRNPVAWPPGKPSGGKLHESAMPRKRSAGSG